MTDSICHWAPGQTKKFTQAHLFYRNKQHSMWWVLLVVNMVITYLSDLPIHMNLTPSLCSDPLKRSVWLMPSPKWALISLARHKASLLPTIGQIGSPKQREKARDRPTKSQEPYSHCIRVDHNNCLEGTRQYYQQRERRQIKGRRGTIHDEDEEESKCERKTRDETDVELGDIKSDGCCIDLSDGR